MTTASRSRLNRARGWLRFNKIFFETIAAALLSMMAVLVSVAQLRTAAKQTDLSEIQTRIAQAQAAPRFEIGFHQIKNEATDMFETNRLVIDNRGGGLRNFAAESASFADVDVATSRNEVGKLEISLGDYLDTQFVSAAGTGTLTTISGYLNNKLFNDFSRQLRTTAEARKWDYALVNTRLYVKLHYIDMLDQTHIDYYRISLVGGASLLPTLEGEDIFKKWRNQPRERLANLDPAQVLDRARPKAIK
jgi:hypothetical protein